MSLLKRTVEAEQYVSYSYTKGSVETFTDPASEAEIEIESVRCFGVEILPAMSRNIIDVLEEECMQQERDNFERGNER